MSELAYLGVALLSSVAGSLVFLRHQRRPESLESGVQQFSRGMSALASTHAAGKGRGGSGSALRK